MRDVDKELVDKYIVAFENADLDALAALLRHDVELEMPPIPTWFAGRDAVIGFFALRPLRTPGRRLIPIGANGCPAVASYDRAADGALRPHSIQVFDVIDGVIGHIYAFRDTRLFKSFGLPQSLDE